MSVSKSAPFLTADEIAIFRCDCHDAASRYDGQSFIARGPIKRFGEAFEQAFSGYDYDDCWQVLVVDLIAGHSRDVTDDVKHEFFDTTWQDWQIAARKGQFICPRFMANMPEVIAL